jgi:hypothetical protein
MKAKIELQKIQRWLGIIQERIQSWHEDRLGQAFKTVE